MKILLFLSMVLFLVACASQKPSRNNAALSKSEADKAVKELDRETGMPDSLK